MPHGVLRGQLVEVELGPGVLAVGELEQGGLPVGAGADEGGRAPRGLDVDVEAEVLALHGHGDAEDPGRLEVGEEGLVVGFVLLGDGVEAGRFGRYFKGFLRYLCGTTVNWGGQ